MYGAFNNEVTLLGTGVVIVVLAWSSTLDNELTLLLAILLVCFLGICGLVTSCLHGFNTLILVSRLRRCAVKHDTVADLTDLTLAQVLVMLDVLDCGTLRRVRRLKVDSVA